MTAFAIRRFWIATHRYLGLATLVFLFIAAATGCLLCFDAPLDHLLNRDLFTRPAAGPAVDPLTAVRTLEAARPELRVLTVPLHGPADANLVVGVEPRVAGAPLGYDQVFLAGGDGHVVGVRADQPGWDRRHLMRGVYLFHYTLLGSAPGRWLMGVAALGWLIGGGVGLYLTLPGRGLFLRNWLKAWTVNPRSRLGRLLLDLHQASGLWLLIAVFILAFTSVAMNFFDEVVTPTVAVLSPPRPSPFDGPAARPGPRRLDFAAALAAGTAKARGEGRDWRPAALQYHPALNLYAVTFTRTGVIGYRGLGPVSYLFDAADGRFVYADDPYRDSPGRAVSRALYPLHTGQIAGVPGVAVVLLTGLATIEMCVTGAYVWWVKRGPRIAARKAAAAGGPR